MYLLGNPDHYTNYMFTPFYWKSFVQEARKPWETLSTPQHDSDSSTANPDPTMPIEDGAGQPVHDYICRPIEFESTCLYEGSQTKSKSKFYFFTRDHPLVDTHGIRWTRRVRIPNFIGESLPRSDQGDREFYCSTGMMHLHCTIFHPVSSYL